MSELSKTQVTRMQEKRSRKRSPKGAEKKVLTKK